MMALARNETLSEDMIDATLADSFPASDPPAWTLGRDHYRTELSKINENEKPVMKPNIDLSEQQREAVVKIINALLSDEYLLYTKTRKCHWNVVGPRFNDLHKFFEGQYEELDDMIDEVAERARSLDGWAFGTLAEFSQHARLKEEPGKYSPAREMIAALLADHEVLIRRLRIDLEACVEKYHDAGTSDFLTGLMEKHEKMAWMLRAFLAAESV